MQTLHRGGANSGIIIAIMLKSHEDYVQYSLINNMPLNKDELRAIRLVSTLCATAASLETYDRIMEWHFHETGELNDP